MKHQTMNVMVLRSAFQRESRNALVSVCDMLLVWGVVLAILLGLSPNVVRAEPLQDARLVIEALANTVTKTPVETKVAVPPGLAKTLSEFDPVYQGFSISALSIEDHGGNANAGQWFIGKVVLENPVRRRAILNISSDYRLVNSTLSVVAADVETVPTPFPTVDLYFVPQARNQAVANASNLYEMLARLIENEVPRDQVDAFGGTYFVYAATRERLRGDASLWVRFGDTPGGVGEAQNTTQNFDFEGWRIAVNSTPMAINAGPERYIKVFLQLGQSATGGAPITRLISLTGNKVVNSAALAKAQIKTTAVMKQPLSLLARPSPDAAPVANLAQGTAVGVVAFSKNGQWAYVIDGAQHTGYVLAHQLSVGTGSTSGR